VARVLGGLAPGFIEIRWNGDDRLLEGADLVLSVQLEFFQDERLNNFWRQILAN
jgi:hypothetical protein